MCLACCCAMCACCKAACKCCKCAGKVTIRLLRLALFAFQLVFWIAGLALFALGIYLAVQDPMKHYEAIVSDLSSTLWDVAVGLIIGLGIFIFLIGLLGCCGTLKNDAEMLCWYSVLLLVIFCVQVSAGALIAVQAEEINTYLDDNMQRQVQEEYQSPYADDPMSNSWDNLQMDLECCGAVDYTDYQNSNFSAVYTNETVPWTCCVLNDDDLPVNKTRCDNEATYPPADANFLYLNPDGCMKKVQNLVDDTAMICYIVIYTIAFVELLSVMFGFCMCCSIEGDDEETESKAV